MFASSKMSTGGSTCLELAAVGSVLAVVAVGSELEVVEASATAAEAPALARAGAAAAAAAAAAAPLANVSEIGVSPAAVRN